MKKRLKYHGIPGIPSIPGIPYLEREGKIKMEHFSYNEIKNYAFDKYKLEKIGKNNDLCFSTGINVFTTGRMPKEGQSTTLVLDGSEFTKMMKGLEERTQFILDLVNRYNNLDLGLNRFYKYTPAYVGVYQFPDSNKPNEVIVITDVIFNDSEKPAVAVMFEFELANSSEVKK